MSVVLRFVRPLDDRADGERNRRPEDDPLQNQAPVARAARRGADYTDAGEERTPDARAEQELAHGSSNGVAFHATAPPRGPHPLVGETGSWLGVRRESDRSVNF